MRFYKLFFIKVAIALASNSFLPLPLAAAERFTFNYGLLGFKLAIADLELFVEQGEINNRLNFYLKRVSAGKQEKLRTFLQKSYAVDPVLAYRFTKTSVGEKVLQRLGDIVQIPEDLNGFYGLRAAIVNTASSSEDFNVINLAKRFPVNVKLNLEEVLNLTKQISRSEAETKKFIDALKEQDLDVESLEGSKAARALANLGSFDVVKQQIRFEDIKRDRQINTVLYTPEQTGSKAATTKFPVIIVSNGLGARPSRFDELANHLASYGFGVVVIDHPGSNHDRQQEFIKGLHQENFAASDYIDRPLDVSFILDSLSEPSHDHFANQLDLEQVGIFGYSIGGTTALSLTGAKIDFHQLEKECQEKLDLTNISILYQCRALELEGSQKLGSQNLKSGFNLKDDRIKAAFLFVPFGKSLFNQAELSEITTPMLWQVVDKDFLTSLTKEQLPIYNALNNSDRHLVLSENLPHSTAILAKSRSQTQQNQAQISRRYQNILSLVFFRSYLTKQENFSTKLDQHLLRSIEEKPYSLYLHHQN